MLWLVSQTMVLGYMGRHPYCQSVSGVGESSNVTNAMRVPLPLNYKMYGLILSSFFFFLSLNFSMKDIICATGQHPRPNKFRAFSCNRNCSGSSHNRVGTYVQVRAKRKEMCLTH